MDKIDIYFSGVNKHQLLEGFIMNAYRAYDLSLTGCLAGNTSCRKFFERSQNPIVGDLVMEVTTIGDSSRHMDRIGTLISVEEEEPLLLSKEEYKEEEWGTTWPPYLETVWRINTLDCRDYAWCNAKFIAIPIKNKGQFTWWRETS